MLSENKRKRINHDNEQELNNVDSSIEPKNKKLSTSTIMKLTDNYNHVTKLKPLQFETLTKEDVLSLLLTHTDLSIKDVKPLYDNIKNFDGSFLASIVFNVKEKNKEYAIKKLVVKCLKVDIRINNELQDTIEQIVDWIDKQNKTNEALITPDELKCARNNPLYDYLRNLNDPLKMYRLETMIGSNIQLPILGSFASPYVPKDFKPTTPYLLTRQSFEILKKVINTRSEEGFVLSGPFGISKSYIMYLIACYAIVNSIPLLYVPLCGIWVRRFKRGGDNGADNYLRSLIFYYNSDILSQNQILQLYNTSIDVVSTFSSIFSKDKIIYYLFDEHHELFWKDINGKMPIQETYFSPYSHFKRITTLSDSQCFTMTIYCGSAHSKFENNLDNTKIIRIIPPTSLEFQKLVENVGFKLNSNRIKKIEYATGRIPRELLIFSEYVQYNSKFTDKQVNNYILNRMEVYEQRIYKLYRNSTQNESFLKAIHYLFNLVFIDNSTFSSDLVLNNNDEIFYDLGLVYMITNNTTTTTTEQKTNYFLYPINQAAKRILENHVNDLLNRK